jgi:O-antigen ligase
MRILLLILTGFMTLSSVFDWDPGPAPGVKIKNAILYLLCAGIFMKSAREGRVNIEVPGIYGVFAVRIAYTILTYIVIVTLIHYPNYPALENALLLKNFVDELLFFIVFFYGVRDEKEAISVLYFLAACWALSHVVAVLDASGIVHIGHLEQRRDGRVEGTLGESNQYGAFCAISLPPMVAAAFLNKGFRRLFWIGASLVTTVTLLLTASRGAFVGVVMSCLGSSILFKRYLSLQKLFMWGLGAFGVVLVALLLVGVLGYGDLLYGRIIGETDTGDMTTTSSGRLMIWSTALHMMAQHPITFLTGFGWRAYFTMPFQYAPHNFYLNSWFNLGLIGLFSGIYLLLAPVRAAYRAIDYVSPRGRIVLIGFSMASISFAVASFFVDVVVPWLYFFAYAGLAMRIAVNGNETVRIPTSTSTVASGALVKADRFGWARPAHH